MAISRQFNGATIKKPGAYSHSVAASNGAGASSTTGVMMIIGEATAGAGGVDEGIQTFPASAYSQMAAKYKSGPILDCAKNALAPSTTQGIAGVQTFQIYKTNQSIRASHATANSYGTLTSSEYGVGGNRISYQAILSSETVATVTGSAPVTAFVALQSKNIIISQNGAAPITITFPGTVTTMANVISAFSTLTGMTASATSGGALVLTMNASANHNRDGIGRSFEIISGSALSDLSLTAGIYTPAAEPMASLSITQPRDKVTQSGVVGGAITLKIGRDASGSCTAASVTTSATSMTLSQTGATPSSIVFDYAIYPTIGTLVDAIRGSAGWSVLASASVLNTASTGLDHVTIGAFSAAGKQPARIKSDVNSVVTFFQAVTLANLAITATSGLPDAEGSINMIGGSKGASASSDFDAGLSASLGVAINVIVPAISQDASVDLVSGLTDALSTYDIETVHAMVTSNLELRGNIQNRNEAQGVVGYRVPAMAAAFEQAATIGDSLVQLVMEDVLVVDSSFKLSWCQPHVLAAMIGAMRCGSPIGEPLTHKYLAVSGAGHFVNPSTGVSMGDYNPLINYDQAISAGVTSTEANSGAHRVMVDNTTYGVDDSFLYNRGSVVEAKQYVEKTLRAYADIAFVGKKNAAVSANSVKTALRAQLSNLLGAQIITSDDQAPLGYVESTFTVVFNPANTCTISLEYHPVQSIDFVLFNFTVGEGTQSA